MYTRQKMPVAKIAAHFGVSEASMYGFMKRNNIAPDRSVKKKLKGAPTIPGGKKMWIRRMYLSGVSQKEIAEKLELSAPTIRKYLREYGVLKEQQRQAAGIQHQPIVPAKPVPTQRSMWRKLVDWFKG